MKVVTPVTHKTLKPYAKLGKSNGKIQGRICDLLFRLIQTDDPAKVKALCESEIEWLTGEYEKASTRTSYVSAYRKAIRAYFDEHRISETLSVEKQTVKGLVVNHLAESYLMAPAEDYATVRKINKTKTAVQRDNLTGFNAADALEATKQAVQSEDWRDLAASLIMATQSRPSDMLKTGEFKAISKYRLEFSSRAKKRGAIAKGEIFCLIEASVFVDAFSRLRREPDVMEMRDWALKDVDSGKNATLNRAVKRIYGDIIPVPFGEKELSCKNLRAAGVNVAYWLHGRDNQSLGRFAELQLLHENPGTAANYEDFYCTKENGKRLLEVGILKDAPLSAKPLSEKRSSLSLDKQLLEMVSDAAQWGEGSHADRLERIIARAKQADRVEAQLARECEKRQQLEFQVKRLQATLLEQPEPEYRPIEEHEFIRADKLKIAPKPVAEDEPTGFDWRSVPNDVLNGDRRHDAYPEKLRRSVEAIQEYNAGLEDSEQFSITGSLLRQIAKVKPGLVKKWMAEHSTELEDYNAGYGARQNTGKPEPRAVIKWSEVAYGAYNW
ncbi:MAG: protelomerase family protein [Cyanobacteria bacterium J06607_10]